MPSPKFPGKTALLEYSIAPETATVGALTWTRFGMMRGKSVKLSWDTVDATGDTSPGFGKEMLGTYQTLEISGDAVAYGEAISGQKALRSLLYNPGAGTDYQPKAWVRVTDPDGSMFVASMIFTEFGDERPYSDAATCSISATSNGAITYTPT